MSMFKKASRKRVYLKIGLMGASGAGKTRSALELAKGLAEGGPIAVIDTENGSASLYSHVAEFDVCDVEPPFDPEKYIAAIRNAEEAGYKVLIIDSFSHAWKYLLDKKEKLDNRGGRQNQYTNWGPVKAEADRLKDAILQSRIHIIACMRAKTEYAQENGKVQKVGLAAIQEPDVEYEFTVVFQIDMAHNAQQTKDRTGLFADRVFRIDPKTGQTLLNWLNSAEGQDYAIPPAASQAESQPTQNPIVPTERPNTNGHTTVKPLPPARAFLQELGVEQDPAKLEDLKTKAKVLDMKSLDLALQAKEAGVKTADELATYCEAMTYRARLESEAEEPIYWDQIQAQLTEHGIPFWEFLASADRELVSDADELATFLADAIMKA